MLINSKDSCKYVKKSSCKYVYIPPHPEEAMDTKQFECIMGMSNMNKSQ